MLNTCFMHLQRQLEEEDEDKQKSDLTHPKKKREREMRTLRHAEKCLFVQNPFRSSTFVSHSLKCNIFGQSLPQVLFFLSGLSQDPKLLKLGQPEELCASLGPTIHSLFENSLYLNGLFMRDPKKGLFIIWGKKKRAVHSDPKKKELISCS